MLYSHDNRVTFYWPELNGGSGAYLGGPHMATPSLGTGSMSFRFSYVNTA